MSEFRVLRWGRSAYETDAQLDGERAACEAAGARWALQPDVTEGPGDTADLLFVTSKVRVTDAVLDRVGCRAVVTTTSGVDHLDPPAAAERGVHLARMPLARRDAVVEHAIASLITLLRRLPDLHGAARAGQWARGDLPTLAPRGLRDSRIAVIGLGVIGAHMARTLVRLGADVVGVDPHAIPEGVLRRPLDQALEGVDAVTLHCELNEETRRLLGRTRLSSLPTGTVVVNTARGALLDVAAAVDLVHAGHLGGLAVDVFPEEPWPDMGAASDGRILFTPHASGYTADLGDKVIEGVDRAVRAFAAGEPLPFPVGSPRATARS